MLSNIHRHRLCTYVNITAEPNYNRYKDGRGLYLCAPEHAAPSTLEKLLSIAGKSRGLPRQRNIM